MSSPEKCQISLKISMRECALVLRLIHLTITHQ
uniref:Uncharacterized protein n=1 Tax=Anguilla anguilla TaxID=7936 RepID=A0A0E9TFV5_ANGAN